MNKLTIFTAIAILSGAATMAMTGCEAAKDAAKAGADQCGFTCNGDALAEGQVSISGVANIDAFFNQVANFNATATVVADGLTAPMARIKAQLGLPATATGAEVAAKMKADFQLDGDVKIVYAPPSCEISAKATVDATAKCDASVDPGSVKASCEGRCEADVQVSGGKVECSGEAKLHCTAPSVNVACTGSCKGSCELTAAAACSGTCKGTCDGTCEVKDAAGKCAGTCDGKCQGTCELSAGGSCSGTCSGDCAVESTTGSCTGGAKVECFAEPPTGSASVTCEGKCEGSIEPPKASVECEASAKAEAEMRAECTPPSIDVTANLSASANAEVTARYDAFLEVFKTEMGVLVANLRRGDVVLKAGASVVASVPDVAAAFKAALPEASGNLKLAAGLGCAGTLIVKVPDAMAKSTDTLSKSVTGAGTFVAAFK